MSRSLNCLEYLVAVAVFGCGGEWAHRRDAAEAADARHMASVYEYRAIATCVDHGYMAAGKTLEYATWICEIDPATYPEIE
jgi:hypothetical protein